VVQPAQLREQDRRAQLGHAKVEAQEGALTNLDVEAQRRMTLVVERKASAIQVLVTHDQQAAIAGRNRLDRIEADGAGYADTADGLPLVGGAESLRLHAIGFNYRRLPALALMKRMVDDGAVGQVQLFRTTWLTDEFSDPSVPFDWVRIAEVARW
jgi:hypothetical protein